MVDYFRETAQKQTVQKPITLDDLLDPDDAGKRILYIMPESIGDVFMSTALFKSLKEQYPWANLYVATKPQYFEVLEGNPYVHRFIPYADQMDSQVFLEGVSTHKGFFELSFHPYFGTQKLLDYLNNGKTNLAVDLKA